MFLAIIGLVIVLGSSCGIGVAFTKPVDSHTVVIQGSIFTVFIALGVFFQIFGLHEFITEKQKERAVKTQYAEYTKMGERIVDPTIKFIISGNGTANGEKL